MNDPKDLPKVGTIIKTTIGEQAVAVDYKIIDKLFAHRLPYAVIVAGPNTGVEVILHSFAEEQNDGEADPDDDV